MITRLEELIAYIADKGGWFATLGEIYDATNIAKVDLESARELTAWGCPSRATIVGSCISGVIF